MRADRLRNLPAHREHGIERGRRLLEDVRDAPATQGPHAPLAHRPHIPAVEQHLSARLVAGARHQPRQRQGRYALARSALAHQRRRLAVPDGKGNPVDRPHRTGPGPEVDAQIPHLKQRSALARSLVHRRTPP